jgi:Starter unit:ACP transacylase in aflatoxin biosynthesis
MTGTQAQPPSMSRNSRALVFADQSVEIRPSLQRLWRFARDSAVLEAFLRRGARVICDQAGCVPEARGLFPTEESLLDLCRDYKETNIDIIVRTVLLSLDQLGWLLVYVATDHLNHILTLPQGSMP